MSTKHTKEYLNSLDRGDGEPTPGEWSVAESNHYKHLAYIYAKRNNYFGGCCVAEVRSETIMDDELDANARVMAASPELLDALKSCLEWMEFTIPHLKATCPHCGGSVDCGGLNWGGPVHRAKTAIAKATEGVIKIS